MNRKAYPSDVSDDEWAFIAPYLRLMKEDAAQREYSLREVFNGARWIIRAGAAWRMMPHDLPPWHTVYQQRQRWIAAGVFEAIVHDLRVLLCVAAGRAEQPSAVILDGRTIQSTPESGERAGFDGAKRKKGSKVHIAVDTLGHLLALHVTAANEQERQQVYELAKQVQEVTGDAVSVAFVDEGYTGPTAEQMAAVRALHGLRHHGIQLIVVKRPEASQEFVLLPKRWVVERSFAWTGRFRRLARDYERLADTLAGLHFLAFAILMLKNVVQVISSSA